MVDYVGFLFCVQIKHEFRIPSLILILFIINHDISVPDTDVMKTDRVGTGI